MLIGLGALATVGIFVLDCVIPLGVADGMLYMIPVLMGLWIPDKRYTYVSAIVCGLLIAVGYFVSPPGGIPWMVITNRFLSLIAIWVSAAVCLLQKRTQDELDRENAFTQLLQSVAIAANELENIEDALQISLDKVCSVTGWPVGHAYLWCPESNDLVPAKVWHLDDPIRFQAFVDVTEKTTLDSGVGLPGRVLKTAKPAWIIDVTQDANFPRNKLAQDIAVKGGFAFPVLIKDEVVGVLEFFSSQAEEPDALLLESMASIGVQLGRVIERGRLHEAEEKARANLEKCVQARTEELSKSNSELQNTVLDLKLAEKKKEELFRDLEYANNELGEFAYIVSHDLKEPVRGVSSLAQWISEDYAPLFDDNGRAQMQLLMDNTKRMYRLIDGILSYCKVGREKMKIMRLDLDEVVTDVIKSFKIPDNVQVYTEGELPGIYFFRLHLEQVLQNLIGNAIKHLGKSKGDVIVSCRDAGEIWELCVRDNGVGIEERHFNRIFKLFQVLNKENNYSDSTGIGLALVKKIADIHGEEVWVESEVGVGTAFYFTITKNFEETKEE